MHRQYYEKQSEGQNDWTSENGSYRDHWRLRAAVVRDFLDQPLSDDLFIGYLSTSHCGTILRTCISRRRSDVSNLLGVVSNRLRFLALFTLCHRFSRTMDAGAIEYKLYKTRFAGLFGIVRLFLVFFHPS